MHLRRNFKVLEMDFWVCLLFAPFDKILVTCGAEILPIELLKQLKIGRKMVIPMGKTDEQILYRFTKISEKNLKKKNLEAYKFVPMLQDRNK